MKGKYLRDDKWREKRLATHALNHSIIVTDTPRTGALSPYIGRIFKSQRELAVLVGVSPRTVNYWLSMGYVNLIKKITDEK